MKIDRDYPAYPIAFEDTGCHGERIIRDYYGINVRQYFIGQALIGVCSQPLESIKNMAIDLGVSPEKAMATLAFSAADAVIDRFEKELED